MLSGQKQTTNLNENLVLVCSSLVPVFGSEIALKAQGRRLHSATVQLPPVLQQKNLHLSSFKAVFQRRGWHEGSSLQVSLTAYSLIPEHLAILYGKKLESSSFSQTLFKIQDKIRCSVFSHSSVKCEMKELEWVIKVKECLLKLQLPNFLALFCLLETHLSFPFTFMPLSDLCFRALFWNKCHRKPKLFNL